MTRSMKTLEKIRRELFSLQDEKYREFQAKLMPTVNPEKMIGVRTPELRHYAKQLIKSGEASDFIKQLPHDYFDENQLHAFIISDIKEYDRCISEVKRFLPCVDNWATCDQLSPKVFKKHKAELLIEIKKWIKSKETYTIRFGIGMLMQHFLDEDFRPEYPKMVVDVKSDEYYVNMMRAWYFATALARQYEQVLPYIENKVLDKWTHNKAIQKSVESYRISPKQKTYLKTLRRSKESILEPTF